MIAQRNAADDEVQPIGGAWPLPLFATQQAWPDPWADVCKMMEIPGVKALCVCVCVFMGVCVGGAVRDWSNHVFCLASPETTSQAGTTVLKAG